jgi:hypothetical protein
MPASHGGGRPARTAGAARTARFGSDRPSAGGGRRRPGGRPCGCCRRGGRGRSCGPGRGATSPSTTSSPGAATPSPWPWQATIKPLPHATMRRPSPPARARTPRTRTAIGTVATQLGDPVPHGVPVSCPVLRPSRRLPGARGTHTSRPRSPRGKRSLLCLNPPLIGPGTLGYYSQGPPDAGGGARVCGGTGT